MRSGARLAAWIPATRATASTSPLVTAPRATSEEVSGCMYTRPLATARRWVGSLGVTSTIRARPSGSRWVSPRSDMAASLGRPRSRLRRKRSAADLRHRPAGPHERNLADLVAGSFRRHRGRHDARDGVVVTALTERGPQVDLFGGEEARAQATVGGQADAVAGRAERLGDRVDDAELAPAVEVTPAGRRLVLAP